MSHWFCSRPVISATLLIMGPHWDFFGYLVLLCATDILQLWIWRASSYTYTSSSSMGGCWGGPTHSTGSVSEWLVGLNSLPVLLHLHYQHNLFSTSCIISPSAAGNKGWVQLLFSATHGCFTSIHITRAIYFVTQASSSAQSPKHCTQWGAEPAFLLPWPLC